MSNWKPVATLARAAVYSTLFIGFLLVFLPRRVLEWSGIAVPAGWGPLQILGVVLTTAGAVLAVWCILTFAVLGRGTPAPFDPPRKLVERGPYRWVRNPMYLGAGFALLGAGVYFESTALLGYLMVFMTVSHLFVLGYEEPTLDRLFGADYAAYRERTGRWWPRR